MVRLGKRVWLIIGLAVVAVPVGILLLPARAPDDVVLAHIQCATGSIALAHYLFARAQAGEELEPAVLAGVERRKDQLQTYLSELYRREDPRMAQFRPAMSEAVARRDAAVAEDGASYIRKAWTELRTCHDTLYPGASR